MDPTICPPSSAPARSLSRSAARFAAGLALTSQLSACGGSDPTAPAGAAVQAISAAGAASTSLQDRPGLNPAAAGTHLFDPVQGQPIPALTPIAPGSAPVPALLPAAGQALAAAATGGLPDISGQAPGPASEGTAPAPTTSPVPVTGTTTIVVTPGLSVDRERIPNPRLDRSARP
jgi:hypothetical protein